MFSIERLQKHFYILLLLILLIGGLGIEGLWVSWIGMVILVLLLVGLVFKGEKIFFPKYFKLFSIILLFLVLNLLVTNNLEETLKFLFVFFGGGAVWLLVYNLPKKTNLNKNFPALLLILALIFGQYVIVESILKVNTVKSFSIVGYSSLSRNHHHIGDFFAIIGAVSFYKLLFSKQKRWSWGAIFFASLCFIIFSESRSAVLSLGVPIGIFLWAKGFFVNRQKLVYLIFGILILTIFYFARSKSILLVRPYFFEAIIGFIRNPIGVGMGNFAEIALDDKNHIFGIYAYSVSVHNLPLEFLVGMGVFGLLFVYFYFKSFVLAFERITLGKNVVAALVFISLSVNFFFDFTYTIPMMIWLWFLTLGLLEKVERKEI